MAAAILQPSPRAPHIMATARMPLANNPNAANSPFQGLGPISGKRSRAQTETTKELVHGLPPAKRQLVVVPEDGENAPPRALSKQTPAMREAESRLLMRRPANAPVTELNKRLLGVAKEQQKVAAAQDKQARTTTLPSRKTDESLETVRQWQKHYKKQFPHFVIYFDNVSEETRAKYSRLVQSLSAKEEKFFSKSVTHVITTRPIPDGKVSNTTETRHDAGQIEQQQKTINPALLNRIPPATSNNALRRTTDLLDASLQSRTQGITTHGSQMIDLRRAAGQPMDILVKARELGIKIWALEKLQRMMSVMFNSETGEQHSQQALSRSHATQNLVGKANKELELQRMLRYEKIAGPADRDMTVATQDMVQLRGFYIYVHDMDEKTRPTMVRDYPKPATKEEGKWPQFRLSSAGRCPFIEDPAYTKRVAVEEKQNAELARCHATNGTGPRTRTQAAADHTVLAERQANMRRSPRKHSVQEMAKPLDPPKIPLSRHNSTDMPPLFGSAQANMRGKPRYIGGEPVASGVGPSNITSAIRSRVISSTAISSTAPDARAGTSKELHALKRKVLERGTTVTSGQTLTSSYMNDVRAALNGDSQQRSRKRTAHDALGNIHEEADEDEQRPRKVIVTRRTKTVVHKDPKPGYCENCRDKFDDFDEHVVSRKHRKFALDQQNWAQLDKLLGMLGRH